MRYLAIAIFLLSSVVFGAEYTFRGTDTDGVNWVNLLEAVHDDGSSPEKITLGADDGVVLYLPHTQYTVNGLIWMAESADGQTTTSAALKWDPDDALLTVNGDIIADDLQVRNLTSGSVLYYDGSVIQEENGELFYDATNNRLIIHDSSAPQVGGFDSAIHIKGDGTSGYYPTITVQGVATAPFHVYARANGTKSSLTTLLDGHSVGGPVWYGYDGSGWRPMARIHGFASAAPSGSVIKGGLALSVNNGIFPATGWTDAIVIDQNQTYIQTASGYNLDVQDDIGLDGLIDQNGPGTNTFVGNLRTDGVVDSDGTDDNTFAGGIDTDGTFNALGIATFQNDVVIQDLIDFDAVATNPSDNGDMLYSSDIDGMQFFMGDHVQQEEWMVLFDSAGTSKTITGTDTGATASSIMSGTKTIDTDLLNVGTIIRMEMKGYAFRDNGHNVWARFYVDGSNDFFVIVNSGSNMSGNLRQIDFWSEIEITSLGVSGTYTPTGELQWYRTGNIKAHFAYPADGSEAGNTIDTSTDPTLEWRLIWGGSDPADAIVITDWRLMVKQPME